MAGKGVVQTLRYLVSRDKNRLQLEGFDFDLTYITSRMIAMGLPGKTIDKAWRNDADTVAEFFNTYHSDHYLIYNLAGVSYDYSKFKGKVVECGWPDHRPPGLELLNGIVLSMHNFLQKDQRNVVAVHCLAGRGRTGTVIAAYLLYSRLHPTPEAALHFFATMRSSTNEGVTGPSQVRYIRYYADFIRGDIPDNFVSLRLPPVIQLCTLSIDPPPFSDCALTMEVYPLDRQDICLWKFKWKSRDEIRFPLQFCYIHGDIEIRFSHTVKNQLEWTSILRNYSKLEVLHTAWKYPLIPLFRCAFSTIFMPNNNLLQFGKSDLDAATSGPCKNSMFPSNMCVAFQFKPGDPHFSTLPSNNSIDYPQQDGCEGEVVEVGSPSKGGGMMMIPQGKPVTSIQGSQQRKNSDPPQQQQNPTPRRDPPAPSQKRPLQVPSKPLPPAPGQSPNQPKSTQTSSIPKEPLKGDAYISAKLPPNLSLSSQSGQGQIPSHRPAPSPLAPSLFPTPSQPPSSKNSPRAVESPSLAPSQQPSSFYANEKRKAGNFGVSSAPPPNARKFPSPSPFTSTSTSTATSTSTSTSLTSLCSSTSPPSSSRALLPSSSISSPSFPSHQPGGGSSAFGSSASLPPSNRTPEPSPNKVLEKLPHLGEVQTYLPPPLPVGNRSEQFAQPLPSELL